MIRESIAKLLREHLGVEEIPLNLPPRKEMGDLSSAICLSLGKQRRRSPMEIAKETAERLRPALPPYIRELTVTPPGYLNFKVDWPLLTRNLLPRILETGKDFGRPESSRGEKVFIEHTSVNPNKAMHIGHLRNAVLGDTIGRIFKWLGFTTEICNYIDDTGVQVVDVVTAFLYLDPPYYGEGSKDFRPIWDKAPRDQAFDYFCWDLYARFQNEVGQNPSLMARKEDVLHRIEGGSDPVASFAKELATRIVGAHL